MSRAEKTWKITTEKLDPLQHLEKALAENRISESLRELMPQVPEYQRLRTVLSKYKTLKSQGGWLTVAPNLKLKPGQRSPYLSTLAKRLAATGDYQGTLPPDGQTAVYEGNLVEAVKVFQRRHGLVDDGVITPAVAAEMNVPVDRRIAQIQMNMERWRWLPRSLGSRYILVNIPEMRLDIYEGETPTLTMKTVVGKEDTPTPIFNDEMTHIIFSPYWNVPPSIAQEETLPAVLNDPGFLARNNMEVVDASGNRVDPGSVELSNPEAYRFRQRPGADNSLGLVKFMFPNQFNVYCTTRRPTHCSRARRARIATDASASSSPSLSRTTCCATSRNGRPNESSRRCMLVRRNTSSCRRRFPCISGTGRRACGPTARCSSGTTCTAPTGG